MRARVAIFCLSALVAAGVIAYCTRSGDESATDLRDEKSTQPRQHVQEQEASESDQPAGSDSEEGEESHPPDEDWGDANPKNVISASTRRRPQDCSKQVIKDVRRCLDRLHASLRREAVIDVALCDQLTRVYDRYKDREFALEAKRQRMVGDMAATVFKSGKAEVFFADEVWNEHVTDPGVEERLRKQGYRPMSEAPRITAKHEHQSWHFVQAESEGLPKSPLYPATHLVRFKFGDRPELDKPMAKFISLQKERGLLYATIIPQALITSKEK